MQRTRETFFFMNVNWLKVVYAYLPNLMLSPKVTMLRTTEMTVPMGLNMDTRTGPLFFIAHPLKLTQAPPTPPACALSYNKMEFYIYDKWGDYLQGDINNNYQ